MGNMAQFKPLTNEKRHFLSLNGRDTPTMEYVNNGNSVNEDLDLSLWDNKQDSEQQTNGSQMVFDNQVFSENEAPEVQAPKVPDQFQYEVPNSTATTRQDEAVNDMIDILINPDS